MRKALDFGNASTNCFDFEEALAFLASPVVQDKRGRKGLIATPVYLVDPCQNGVAPLRTATIYSASTGDSAAFLSVLQSRFQRVDTPTLANTVNPVYDFSNYGYHGVSATNSAQTAQFDTKGLNTGLAVIVTLSAGTATLKIEGSYEGTFAVQDVIVENLAAAASFTKNYDRGHGDVGANVAVSPLDFRFLKITVGTAGVGNTSTLDIAMK